MTVIASIKIKQSGVNFLNKDYTCTPKERGRFLAVRLQEAIQIIICQFFRERKFSTVQY